MFTSFKKILLFGKGSTFLGIQGRTLIFIFVLLAAFGAAPNAAEAFTIKKGGNTIGLAAWWPLDGKDVVGGTILDASGNGNHGNALNYATSTFFAMGKQGQGLNFDGVNDYVAIRPTSGLPIYSTTLPYSVAFWIKAPALANLDAYIEGGDSSTAYLFLGSTNSTPFQKFRVVIRNDAGAFPLAVNSTGNVFDNTWHHVVWTDVAGAGKLYIDGGLDSASFAYTPSAATPVGPTIGKNAVGSYLNGSMDDVRVYRRALSQSEITALYANGQSKQNASKNNLVTNGLVGLWSFDGKDTVGGTIYDRSGNGNNASALNYATSTFYSVGKIGQALNFDGVDDFVTTNKTPASFSSVSAGTMSAWIKPSKSQSNGAELFNDPLIVGVDVATGAEFGIFIDPTNITFDTFDGSVDAVVTSTYTPDTWIHVVWVQGGGRLKGYVNGVQVGDVAANDRTTQGGIEVIGGGNTGPTGKFKGLIDDVRIYNRPLSQAEITQLYAMGQSKQNASKNNFLTNGLVGLWSFDGKDTLGGTIFDRSGNGNNGSAVNYATSTFFAPGKIGQGLNFDGVNDYVSLPSVSDSFYRARNRTISLWFKPNIGSLTGHHAMFVGYTTTSEFSRLNLDLADGYPHFYFSIAPSPMVDIYPVEPDLTANQWHHAAVTWDTTTYTLYVDGLSVGTYVDSGITTDNSFLTTIGGNIDSGNLWYFDGSIDDVRIYNRALSAAEVSQLYNTGK